MEKISLQKTKESRPSIRRPNATWKVRRDFINFERRIHVGNYGINSTWKFRRGFDFQNRRNIDEFTWTFLCRFDIKLT